MPDLIELPIDQARRLKYEVGLKQYRGGYDAGEFVGDWLVESDQEYLDGINFAEHGLRVESAKLRPKIQRLFDLSIEGAQLCREIYRERESG